MTEYEWNFGDCENAAGPIVTHVYSGLGTYIVSLMCEPPNSN